MKIVKPLVVIVIVAAAFGAGIYFKDDTVRIYSGVDKQIQNLKTTDFGSVVNQVSKQLLTPAPLFAKKDIDSAELLQSKIITETNLQRQENELPALTESAMLDKAAAAKANDMFLKEYFEHVSPIGVDPGKLVQKHGYDYIVAGENLILGNFSSEKEVVQDWMNSPGHRANILNNRYTEIGVAIIKGTYKGETVWIGVQEFGLPLSGCVQPGESLKNLIDSGKSQLEVLSPQIDEARNQIDDKSPAYKQMVEDYNQLIVQYNLLAEQLKAIIVKYNGEVNNFNNCVAGK